MAEERRSVRVSLCLADISSAQSGLMNSGQSVGKEEGHWAGPTSAPLGQHCSGSDTHSAVVKLLLLCPRQLCFFHYFFFSACL